MKEFLEDRTSSQTRTAGTRGRIRRRTVYIATVIAMIAMVGGFALATYTFSTTVSSEQNIYQTSLSDTVWQASAVTLTPGFLNAAVTCASPPLTTSQFTATGGTANVCYVASGSSNTMASETTVAVNEYVEEFEFNLPISTACSTSPSCTSTFQVTVIASSFTSTGTVGQNSFAVSITTAPTGADTLFVYLDFGTTAPSTISGMDFVVT